MTKYLASILPLCLTAALALSLTACQDKEARRENEQLKAQVLELQKQLGEMGNRVDEATKARDDAMNENAVLRAENNRLKKKKRGETKTSKRHSRRPTSLLQPWQYMPNYLAKYSGDYSSGSQEFPSRSE